MATFVDSKYSAALCILLGSLSVAFSDVVSIFRNLFSLICYGSRLGSPACTIGYRSQFVDYIAMRGVLWYITAISACDIMGMLSGA